MEKIPKGSVKPPAPMVLSGEHGPELMLGVTMAQAAEALRYMATVGRITLTPDPIGDSSDGIKPCGYEEL